MVEGMLEGYTVFPISLSTGCLRKERIKPMGIYVWVLIYAPNFIAVLFQFYFICFIHKIKFAHSYVNSIFYLHVRFYYVSIPRTLYQGQLMVLKDFLAAVTLQVQGSPALLQKGKPGTGSPQMHCPQQSLRLKVAVTVFFRACSFSVQMAGASALKHSSRTGHPFPAPFLRHYQPCLSHHCTASEARTTATARMHDLGLCTSRPSGTSNLSSDCCPCRWHWGSFGWILIDKNPKRPATNCRSSVVQLHSIPQADPRYQGSSISY